MFLRVIEQRLSNLDFSPAANHAGIEPDDRPVTLIRHPSVLNPFNRAPPLLASLYRAGRFAGTQIRGMNLSQNRFVFNRRSDLYGSATLRLALSS